MKPIISSFFDIYKIGPGPSSSHTIGPMKAAYHFIKSLKDISNIDKATHFKILLYGSLSATGKGHFIDKAIVAGLMGFKPEDCDIKKFLKFFEKGDEIYEIKINKKKIILDFDSLCFEEIHHLFPFANTMIIRLMSKEKILLEKEYYSMGGGFIKCKTEEEKILLDVKYKYSNMKNLMQILKDENISLVNLLIKNEKKITNKSEREIFKSLSNVMNNMMDSVKRGLKAKGYLPGILKLQRRAKAIFEKSKKRNKLEKSLSFLHAYSIAAAEENASGHVVVTAPTSGSCGIVASLLYFLKKDLKIDDKILKEGLIVAALIGFLAKQNASISGAEVGCQGEVGIASSMGAAFLAYVNNYPIEVIEMAAKIPIEHFLGLTCDPICGYVQIPCIERNAIGVSIAYSAYVLASNGDYKKQKVSFDQVLGIMLKTGKDMCLKYKETSKGGLALLKF